MSDTVNPAATQDLDAKIIEIATAAIERDYADMRGARCGTAQARRHAIGVLLDLRDAGFEVVPREPTEAMIQAGDDICPIARGTETHKMAGGVVPEDYWRAMVEAARR